MIRDLVTKKEVAKIDRADTTSTDGTINFWDVSERKHLGRFWGHESQVFALALSADGRTLATGSIDGKLKLWDPAARRKQTALANSRVPLAFSSDSRRLFSYSPGGLVIARSDLNQPDVWSTEEFPLPDQDVFWPAITRKTRTNQ